MFIFIQLKSAMFLNAVYLIALFVLSAGLYIMIVEKNLIRKLIGLSLFQTAIIVFFIAIAKLNTGIQPFDQCKGATECSILYSASLTHVLMLTAIVVGFATICVGLALVYRHNKMKSKNTDNQKSDLL